MATRDTEKKGKRFSEAEREFIRNSYPCLSSRSIARKLNRSRTGVDKVIHQMVESGELEEKAATNAPPPSAPMSPPGDGADGMQDTLGRLRWVRSLLERQLYDAEPATAARLAKEYRETLDAIDRLEKEDGDDTDIIDQLAESLSKRLG